MSYQTELENLTKEYSYSVYKLTRKFPKSEIFGVTSQLQRSALSVALNVVEGYARLSKKEYRRFLTISYGSLKESLFLIDFAFNEGYIEDTAIFDLIKKKGDEIGKKIWGVLKKDST